MCVSKWLALALVAATTSADASVLVHRGKQHEFGKAGGNAMIGKIIEMLEEEKNKIAVDVQAESKDMEEYMQYCDDEQSEKAYAIKTAERKSVDLNALIADNGAQIKSLEEEIVELGAEIAERQQEMDDAQKVRDDQHAEFKKREEEQNIIVEEMDNMMVELKAQMAAMTTPPPVAAEGEGEAFLESQDPDNASPMLVQKTNSRLRRNAVHARAPVLTHDMLKGADMTKLRRMMTKAVDALFVDSPDKNSGSFVQEDPLAGLGGVAGGENMPAEEAEEGPSAEENLKAFAGLKAKAEAALQRERDGESNAQQAHNMNKQSLTDQINLAKYKEEESKKDKNKLAEEKGEAEKELSNVLQTKAADEKFLKGLMTECSDASLAWDTRQQEAKAEQAAINKAKEILSSRVTVFVQKSSKATQPVEQSKQDLEAARVRQTLMNHFRNLGNKLKSLSMLNMVSVASVQPFDKVTGLIKNLLAKLEKEAAEAADTHAFCQEEKKKNDEGIKKTTDKLDTLKARLDKAEAKKASLSDDVVELTDEVAAIDKSDQEATKLRQDQHATFAKAEADFSEAADAVQDAIDALKDYYGGASLLQTKKGGAPPQLGGARGDSSNIIVGMMETMAQEFAQTVAKLQAEEKEAVDAYKKMTQENKVSKAAKESEISGSKREIASLDVAIGHHMEDKKLSEKELAAIKEYVESLKPTCYGRVVPYAERKAKREAELDGLKEALAILEESSPSLMQVQNMLRH